MWGLIVFYNPPLKKAGHINSNKSIRERKVRSGKGLGVKNWANERTGTIHVNCAYTVWCCFPVYTQGQV